MTDRILLAISLIFVQTMTSALSTNSTYQSKVAEILSSGKELQFDFCETTCGNTSNVNWSDEQRYFINESTTCEVCRDDDKCRLYQDCCDCHLNPEVNTDLEVPLRCSYYDAGWTEHPYCKEIPPISKTFFCIVYC